MYTDDDDHNDGDGDNDDDDDDDAVAHTRRNHDDCLPDDAVHGRQGNLWADRLIEDE